MPTLSRDEMGNLLMPYLLTEEGLAGHPSLLEQLSVYLDLLLRWNQRMNLTAIRDPRQIVQRHFGESLFAAQHLPSIGRVLDLGSGAGFPGIPVQLWHSRLTVTLAESQAKKAAFLREVIRSLSLPTEVLPGRAEAIASQRGFDLVVLRAVDDPERALAAAVELTAGDVWLLSSSAALQALPAEVTVISRVAMPEREDSWLFQLRR